MGIYLTLDYFNGNLLIHNLSDTGPVGTALQAELWEYIYRYEPIFLTGLLGLECYTKLQQAIDVEEGETPDEQYTALYDEIFVETEISETHTMYRSPVANYVWYMWARDNSIARTGPGDGQPKGGNIQITINNHRFAQVWNEMVEMVEDIDEFIADYAGPFVGYDPETELREYINGIGI